MKTILKTGGRKAKAGFMLLLVVSMVVYSSLFAAPKPAQAQWAVADAPLLAAITGKNTHDTVLGVLTESVVLAVVNGANYFTSQLAYQAALAVTSDCPG